MKPFVCCAMTLFLLCSSCGILEKDGPADTNGVAVEYQLVVDATTSATRSSSAWFSISRTAAPLSEVRFTCDFDTASFTADAFIIDSTYRYYFSNVLCSRTVVATLCISLTDGTQFDTSVVEHISGEYPSDTRIFFYDMKQTGIATLCKKVFHFTLDAADGAYSSSIGPESDDFMWTLDARYSPYCHISVRLPDIDPNDDYVVKIYPSDQFFFTGCNGTLFFLADTATLGEKTEDIRQEFFRLNEGYDTSYTEYFFEECIRPEVYHIPDRLTEEGALLFSISNLVTLYNLSILDSICVSSLAPVSSPSRTYTVRDESIFDWDNLSGETRVSFVFSSLDTASNYTLQFHPDDSSPPQVLFQGVPFERLHKYRNQ